MKADRERVTGFYWIRFEGQVVVAEYVVGGFKIPRWYVPGSDLAYQDSEVCELLSDRLVIAEARKSAGAAPQEHNRRPVEQDAVAVLGQK